MMKRRDVLKIMMGLPMVAMFGSLRARGVVSENQSPEEDLLDISGYQSFAYYQAFGPNESRSPGRRDGTNHNMPCITMEDVQAGVDKTYKFWHSHGTADHMFTITAADFAKLAQGKSIEINTSLAPDHRHAVKVSPADVCRVAPPSYEMDSH